MTARRHVIGGSMIYDVSLAGPNTRGAKSREILRGREAAEQFPFPRIQADGCFATFLTETHPDS